MGKESNEIIKRPIFQTDMICSMKYKIFQKGLAFKNYDNLYNDHIVSDTFLLIHGFTSFKQER